MNSMAEIWEKMVEHMCTQMSPTSVNTWFSECEPLEFENGILVLKCGTDFKRDIILERYKNLLTDALFYIFSVDIDVSLLTEEEYEDYELRKKSETFLPEADGYTFDNFIVGPSNRLAHAASIGVAASPGNKANNPLFIYGNSGLGKTHLLLAIGQAIFEKSPSKKIEYIKGDEFTNQLVESMQGGYSKEFRQKFRNVDLFLVDDVQFIAGKIQTQEEFFHTFNNIYEAGNQIVITSDRPPLEMVKLDDRLRSRFEGGLMVDVQTPEVETRMAITRTKAARLGLYLPDDVVSYIAENITANVRQIEGVIKRLTAYKDLLNDEVTISSVKRAIKDVIRVGTFIPTPDLIIQESAMYYSLSPEDLRGQRRSKNTAMARQISMYLMRNLTNLSLKDIGEQYEDRNHSTVLSSIKKIEDLLNKDTEMQGIIRDISSNINSRS